jgi:spermidine/putrescine-binding protein
MVDFPEFNMWAAAQAVGGGIDTGKMSKEQLQQIVDWLTPVAAQVKTFSPSFGDIITLMAAGEVAAVMPGFGFLVNSAAEAGRKSFEVTDVIREGAVGAVEVLGIPKGASNPDAAYAFLNQMLERDVHVQIAKLQSSAGVVDTNDDLLDAQFRKENHVDEAEQYWKSLAFFTSAPFKSDTYVTQGQMFDAWAKIKASAGQ